jgi:hypothetical protein
MRGVCISMYNSEVLGVLKEEDMPMVYIIGASLISILSPTLVSMCMEKISPSER